MHVSRLLTATPARLRRQLAGDERGELLGGREPRKEWHEERRRVGEDLRTGRWSTGRGPSPSGRSANASGSEVSQIEHIVSSSTGERRAAPPTVDPCDLGVREADERTAAGASPTTRR
jgi:hypothetical protein